MSKNGKLTWTNDKRKLSELIPWPRNPRQVKVDQVKRLQESLTEFGQPETIAIGPGNELYNGHQRLKSWADEFGDIDVDVRVSNRALTEKEREKLTVFLHKGAAGEWDFDILANEFEVDDLLDWGFDEQELQLQVSDQDWMSMFEDGAPQDELGKRNISFTLGEGDFEMVKGALQQLDKNKNVALVKLSLNYLESNNA